MAASEIQGKFQAPRTEVGGGRTATASPTTGYGNGSALSRLAGGPLARSSNSSVGTASGVSGSDRLAELSGLNSLRGHMDKFLGTA